MAIAGLCGALTGCSSQPAKAASPTKVEDHVHGAVAGLVPNSLLVATHYGLETSPDGGHTWASDGGLGDEMIAGLVESKSSYVASLQMMPGMSMPTLGGHGGMQMSGMHMMAGSMSDMPSVAYSTDGRSWTSPSGFPANVQVASLTDGSSPGTVWAALLGRGVYRSTDAGHSWSELIPARVPISVLTAVGQNLLMATPSGVFVTDADQPSMPALAQLDGPVNDLTTVPGCAQCVVAALGTGGLAISHNAGVTWSRQKTPTPFDEVYAAPGVIFGLVASAGADEGVWRSIDNGRHWQRVLAAPLVDHLYFEPAAHHRPGRILAFEWGIKVFESTNRGHSWHLLSRITAR